MKSLALITPKELGLEYKVKTFFTSLDMNYLYYLIHYVLSKLSMQIEAEQKNSNKALTNTETFIPIYSKMECLILW